MALPPNLQSSNLIITGVIDGPLAGGLPKGIELYALDDIADLSAYGVGFSNVGGGPGSTDFTLPMDMSKAGSFITISREADGFEAYFGEAPTYIDTVVNINGDDSVELFFGGLVVDTFGDIDNDGTNTDWEYTNGWAYRNDDSVPGDSVFDDTEWNFCTDDASCQLAFPFKTFNRPVSMT